MELHPELQAKVSRLVTLQTPYRGTEIARWILGLPLLPRARYALMEHVGHLDTVSDSTSWKRHALGVRGEDPA